jgi:hypothetical protein
MALVARIRYRKTYNPDFIFMLRLLPSGRNLPG